MSEHESGIRCDMRRGQEQRIFSFSEGSRKSLEGFKHRSNVPCHPGCCVVMDCTGGKNGSKDPS